MIYGYELLNKDDSYLIICTGADCATRKEGRAVLELTEPCDVIAEIDGRPVECQVCGEQLISDEEADRWTTDCNPT